MANNLYHTFQNLPVYLNNRLVVATNADLSVSAELIPKYLLDTTINNDFSFTNGIVGKLRLSYWLTGSDIMTEYIIRDENRSFAGNFAGLTFNSGYLTSYSLNIKPTAPIQANCEISFFEELGGAINPVPVAATPAFNTSGVLHANDVGFQSLITESTNWYKFSNVSWNFQADIAPEYFIQPLVQGGLIVPSRIVRGQRQISSQFTTFRVTNKLAPTGYLTAVKILCNNQNNVTKEFFIGSGLATSKEISVAEGGIITETIAVTQVSEVVMATQSMVDANPTITSFSPSAGGAGTLVDVVGTNLRYIELAKVGNGEWVKPFLVTETLVRFYVPLTSTTGPITLAIPTVQKQAISATNFTFTTLNITVSSFTPTEGRQGDYITIEGNGFSQISKVLVGTGVCNKMYVNSSQEIVAQVPNYGSSFVADYITVVSEKRNKTGISATKFSPLSTITDIVPDFGIPLNNTGTIRGSNIYNVDTVSFYDNSNLSWRTGGLGTTSSTGIRVTIPPEITTELVKIDYHTDAGTAKTEYTANFFDPIALITSGIYNSSNTVNARFANNEYFYGYAHNLNPSILDSTIDGSTVYFWITMNGLPVQTTRTKLIGTEDWNSSMKFEGYTPTEGSFSGPVYIKRQDGGFFPNPDNIVVYDTLPPEVTSYKTPFTDNAFRFYAFLTGNLSIRGQNLGNFALPDTELFTLSGYWSHLNGVRHKFKFTRSSSFLTSGIDENSILINLNKLPLSGGRNIVNEVADQLHNNPYQLAFMASNHNCYYIEKEVTGTTTITNSNLNHAPPYGNRIESSTFVYNNSYTNEEWFSNYMTGYIGIRNTVSRDSLGNLTEGMGLEVPMIVPNNRFANANSVIEECLGVETLVTGADTNDEQVYIWTPYNTNQLGMQETPGGKTVFNSSVVVNGTRRNIVDGTFLQYLPSNIMYVQFSLVGGEEKVYIRNNKWRRFVHYNNPNKVIHNAQNQPWYTLSTVNAVYGGTEYPEYSALNYDVKTPYYVMRATSGQWSARLNGNEHVNVICILCQDGYHTTRFSEGEGTSNQAKVGEMKLGTYSNDKDRIKIYKNTNSSISVTVQAFSVSGSIYTQVGTDMTVDLVNRGNWSYQGFGLMSNFIFYQNDMHNYIQRAKFNYLEGVCYFLNEDRKIAKIVVKNNSNMHLPLVMVSAF